MESGDSGGGKGDGTGGNHNNGSDSFLSSFYPSYFIRHQSFKKALFLIIIRFQA